VRAMVRERVRDKYNKLTLTLTPFMKTRPIKKNFLIKKLRIESSTNAVNFIKV
jgi:hypothetical protein